MSGYTSLALKEECGPEKKIQGSLEVATTIRSVYVITQCTHTSEKNRGCGMDPGKPQNSQKEVEKKSTKGEARMPGE